VSRIVSLALSLAGFIDDIFDLLSGQPSNAEIIYKEVLRREQDNKDTG